MKTRCANTELHSPLRKWFAGLFRYSRVGPAFGRRTIIAPSAQFIGSQYIEIGNRCIVSEGSWFNVNDCSGSEARIIVGDQSYIGRRTFLSSGKRIRVGPYCLISNDCNLLGADHDFQTPFIPYLVPPVVSESEIDIGPNCWLGSSSIVLKDVSIGFGSIIGAGSIVTKSVPPLSIAVGAPCRVLKRFTLRTNTWIKLQDWTAEDEALSMSEEDYLNLLRDRYPYIAMPNIVAGSWLGNI